VAEARVLAEADRLLAESLADDLLDPDERSAADEEDVRRRRR